MPNDTVFECYYCNCFITGRTAFRVHLARCELAARNHASRRGPQAQFDPLTRPIQATCHPVAISKGALQSSAVLDVLRNGEDLSEGICFSDFCDCLEPSLFDFSAADVRRCIDKLIEDGDIYTMIDDDHFAALEEDD